MRRRSPGPFVANPPARVWVVATIPLAAVVAVDPSGLSPFGPAKWALLTTLVFAAVATQPGPGRRVMVARATVAPWAVFLGAVAVAAAFGEDPLYAWLGTPERHFGALAWLLCGLAFLAAQQLDEDGCRLVAGTLAAAAAVAGVWAVAEQLGWDPIALRGGGDHSVGPLGSSAYLGAAATLLTPVGLGIAVDPRWRLPARRAAAVATAGGAAALVLSGARAAWIGSILGALVAVVARRHALRRHPRLRASLAGAAVAVAAAGLLVGVAGRMGDAVTDEQGGARGRLDEWRVAVRMIAGHPLLGVGPEGYRIAFGQAVDDDYEQEHGRTPLPDRAHSSVLDVAATLGLPGLAAFLVLVAAAGRFVLRSLRTGPGWVAGMAAGLVAYGIQSLVLFPIAELDPVAWLMAGVVVSRTAQGVEWATLTRRRPALVLAGAAGGAAALALVAGVLDVAADRTARDALARVAAGAPVNDPGRPARLRPDALRYRLVAARAEAASTAPGAEGRALSQLRRALDLSPQDPVARAERSRLLLDRARRRGRPADVTAARDALEAMAGRDPRNAETLVRLGLARELDGDVAGAEQAWLAAERLAPRSPVGPANLALAYARAGRWPEARAAARRALDRDPGDQRAAAVMEAASGT